MLQPLTGCARFSHHLPGFVDQSLSAAKLGNVAAHLTSCEGCRAEVAELRAVHDLLRTRTSEGMPSGLSSKLLSIAGDQTNDPLWLATSGGELPSRRVRRARAAKVAIASGATLALMLVALGFLLAPNLRSVTDPGKVAREGFAQALSLSGFDQAVAGMLDAVAAGAVFERAAVAPEPVPTARPVAISPSEGAAWLDHARQIRSGTQQVVIASESGWVRAEAQMAKQDGHVVVSIKDSLGRQYTSGFSLDARADLSAPGCTFYAYGPAATAVDGVSATVLEARVGEFVVARWWLAVESGALLRHERYFRDGRLAVGARKIAAPPASPAARAQVTLTTLPSVTPAHPCIGAAECPKRLAGLELVSFTSSGGPDARVAHLTYSNGVTVLNLIRRPGFLAPDGDLQSEFSAGGMPMVLAWQSGETVLIASTNGSEELLRQARAELPFVTPIRPDVWWQISAGLRRLLAIDD